MIEIRMLFAGDEAVLEHVADDVFDGPVQPALACEYLEDPRHHLIVALDDALVVGMVSGLHHIHPDKPPQMFVMELGVAGPVRRQGIARRLMDALLAHARVLGCSEAWVGTEKDNSPARGLYASLANVETDEASVIYTVPLRSSE